MIGFITVANRGLGLEMVRLGLREGHKMLAACRNTEAEKIQELAALQEQYPDNLEIFKMDVTDENQVQETAIQIQKKYGHVDFLVNNAGVLFEKMVMPGDCIADLDIAMLRSTLEVNLVGVAIVCKYFINLLYQSESPWLINITSEAGHLSPEGYNYLAYSVSKHGANMYTQKIRNFLEEEKKEKHIKTYMVHPGRMDTIMGKENAQIQPEESAQGLYDILSGRTGIPPMDVPFINYKGQPMPY